MTSFFRIAVVSAAALDAAFAQLTERQACEPLPLGSGRVPFPDTAEAFHSFAPFSDAAIAAPTPAGYIKAYSNLHTTYDEPSQFVYYKNMDSYDVAECKYPYELTAFHAPFINPYNHRPANSPQVPPHATTRPNVTPSPSSSSVLLLSSLVSAALTPTLPP